MKLITWIRARWAWLAAEVKAARSGTTRGSDDRVILVPATAGPVVESRDIKTPLPITHVPARSTKANAKRIAHLAAEEHSGRKMTWAQARKYLLKLEREHPDLELPMPKGVR